MHRSSGSRGPRTAVPIDLDYLRENAVNTCLALEARDGLGWQHAIWADPGSAVLVQLLFCAFGSPPARWFLQVDPTGPEVHPRYRWSGRAVYWGSRLAGVQLPRPQHVPLDGPLPIVRWIERTLRAGRTPHLITFTSPAVLLCQAALDSGVDLSGAQLSVGGVPFTPAL